ALVYAVTRYDIGNPQTLLEAAIPGLAVYSQDQRRGLLPAPAPAAPRATVAAVNDLVPRSPQDTPEPPAGSRFPEAAPRPPAAPQVPPSPVTQLPGAVPEPDGPQ